MAKKTLKPAWLIPKKVGKLKPMSTRNVVKRHLKEWNKDDETKSKLKKLNYDDEKSYKSQMERLRTYDKIPTMVGDEDVWEDED